VCLSTRQRSISSCNDTIKQLQQGTPDFTGHQTAQTWIYWIIRSGVLCSREYECQMNSVDELKVRLIDLWNGVHCAAERYWRGHQRVEKATKRMRACRWTTFWTFIASTCDWQNVWTNKVQVPQKTLLYCWTYDFRGLKVSQGKVCTINRWGGISNHLSMAYLLSKYFCQKLVELDNYCWNYRWWLGGILFWDAV